MRLAIVVACLVGQPVACGLNPQPEPPSLTDNRAAGGSAGNSDKETPDGSMAPPGSDSGYSGVGGFSAGSGGTAAYDSDAGASDAPDPNANMESGTVPTDAGGELDAEQGEDAHMEGGAGADSETGWEDNDALAH